MERNLVILLLMLILCVPYVKAEEQIPVTTLVTPQNVDFKLCTRTYVMPAEKLFYMAIASAKENKFAVDEIQSKTGYILFTAAGKQYLASVVRIDDTKTMLKITPTNMLVISFKDFFFSRLIVPLEVAPATLNTFSNASHMVVLVYECLN